MGCAGKPNATPNSNRTGAFRGRKHWRETGAKKGDFPLQAFAETARFIKVSALITPAFTGSETHRV